MKKNIFLFLFFGFCSQLSANIIFMKNDTIFSNITFENYDKKLYKISDFRDKYIFLTICSVDMPKVDTITQLVTNYYDMVSTNRKDCIFITIFCNFNKNAQLTQKNKQLYENITKKIKLKSGKNFLTYEENESRQLTKDSPFSNPTKLVYFWFYIDKNGKTCGSNGQAKDYPCVTKEVKKNFDNLFRFCTKITERLKLNRFGH